MWRLPSPVRRALHRIFSRPPAETSRLIVGSTGSGKSEGELVELVRLARRGDHAVVLLDGHGPLAFGAARAWMERGHAGRMVYEPLDATDRVLCWDMLPRSAAAGESRRALEDAETVDEVAQCFLAHRNLGTLNDRPWTKEWLEAAIALCLAQPAAEPLASLPLAFRVGSPGYERLLAGCVRPDLAGRFRDLERLRRKSEVQYETVTGAGRRLLEQVCSSEVVRLRCRPGGFDWSAALLGRRLVAFDGGGVRSREIKRTLFTLASMGVIHAVRRHFAEGRSPLNVVLVLEEAGALGLVTPFVMAALQELRKAGLSIHLITQSSGDFGDPGLFEAVLANSPWQAWYQCLSPADQELGARALANATFDPLAVHFTRTRQVHDGERPATTKSRGESIDQSTGGRRSEHRTGTAYLAKYRQVTDDHYKSPQVQEQEYRTRLATLRVGERLVRDRAGVRGGRVRPVRSPWLSPLSEEATLAAIDRLRQGPPYEPGTPPEPAQAPASVPDAAARLRERVERRS